MGLEWTDALALGIPEIDAQHRELFARVDRLLGAALQGSDAEVGPLLGYLREYAATHFAAEEELMAAARYPGLRLHRAEHDRFAAELEDLERAYRAGGAAAVSGRLGSALAEWLRDHVYLTDTALARFVKGL